jgi:uncharacterized membrane protein
MSESNTPRPVFAHHIEDAIRSITQLDIEHHGRATRQQRLVEHTTELLGRPWFLGAASVVIVGWTAYNSLAPLLGRTPFDPAPFAWLSTAVSLCAFFVVVLILITQRREEELARHHARLTLQLTIQGEQKTAKVIALLEELRRDSPSVRNRVDDEADAMAETEDPNKLLDAIKEAQASGEGDGARSGNGVS